ncbi:hypothetical protein HJG53_12590 [Sphingomonas sp. ID1715]|uniref:DUF6894 family protein n=1 Tax=Sphingomonas sp. ID1715 TaxID=1656898 RepID=UPI00148966AC|nr:hypothetical protein [Sphingomonas sp. ID1715]NNM77746.1 hypothetical protein [Sphingomonas sp. ID1715]
MRRFYFDLVEGNQVLVDFEGQFLTDIAAAREAAVRTIRDLLGEAARRGLISLDGFIRIRGAGAQIAAIVAFSEAVTVVSDCTAQSEWNARLRRTIVLAG